MRHLKSCLKKLFQGTDIQPEHDTSSSFAMKKMNGETTVLQPAYTIRLKPDPGQARDAGGDENAEQSSTKETSIVWCGMTDTGKVRGHNEDFFSCIDLRDRTVFAVADGMGGHDAGEVASRLAVETVCKEISDGARGTGNPKKMLEKAVQRANSEVLKQGTNKGSNMGTTLTLALVLQDQAYIANVGDSRTYWIDKGSIRPITEDHSLVEKLVAAGKLTREEARKHPKSNVLYRNIGSEAPIKVDVFQVPLRKGGTLLLCTDGLWGEVTDEDIHGILCSENDVRNACERLIRTANENGGKDNITAVVVNVV